LSHPQTDSELMRACAIGHQPLWCWLLSLTGLTQSSSELLRQICHKIEVENSPEN
jgi:hypothetical protein